MSFFPDPDPKPVSSYRSPKDTQSLHRLIVLLVADHRTASVRRQHFGRQEVSARERALAGTAGADEDDEQQVGDSNLHEAATGLLR